MRRTSALIVVAAAMLWGQMCFAQSVNVAAAANFAAPLKQLAALYEQKTGVKVITSFGGTGALYAQIKNGAPFEVFFAADRATPAKLAAEGLSLGPPQPYAFGALVLWSAQKDFVQPNKDFLLAKSVKKIALANPKLAPYGLAAEQTLNNWGLMQSIKPRIVMGDNIGKTLQFVQTGNAQVGFVAQSQVWRDGQLTSGSAWVIPSDCYEPIEQDVVLLKKAEGQPDAAQFLNFVLTSKDAKKVLDSFGYRLP